jgi:cob(I)alamin adenosyltransferase
MNKPYTCTGDDGNTGLLGRGRVPKYHPRIEALGTLDEASAALGLSRALCKARQSTPILLHIQRDLQAVMAEIAATIENAPNHRKITKMSVQWLEQQIESLLTDVNMPEEFLLSGDSTAGAALDLARATVRRAERRVAGLLHTGEIENAELVRYLNRLSSLCFILELLENQSSL